MQYNNEMLSVKELNNVLDRLQNGKPIEPLGTFSEVDIVFIAGLFLWYMQHRDNWAKIRISFNLNGEDNAWNHSHYFQQIFELYNIRHNDIFIDFPSAYNSDANSFSRFFAPIIYITKKSIDYFFGKEKNRRIDNLKEKYKKHFDVSDFVNESYNSYIKHVQEFDKYETEILQRLDDKPSVFVFIFIIASKRLARKEERTFAQTENHIEKIWQFAEMYTNGLHELARNIVEHSGQAEDDGQGMITIRVYSGVDGNKEKIKVLETHVFDYGRKGIFETLRKNTEKNKTGGENDVYTGDYDILIDTQNKYTLSDFIEPADNQKFLLQQFYREMAHYGLMNFKHLIEQHEGRIIASSVREDNENKRERYVFSKNNIPNEEINKYDILTGTSFYFEMLFIPALFERKNKTAQELGNQQNAAALSNLKNFELLKYAEIANQQFAKEKKYLIDLKISDFLNDINNREIDSRKTENDICDNIIEKTNSPCLANTENVCFVLDFNGVMLNKSRLLRILARLSREKLSDFIVYNIACDDFSGLIKDNEQWFQNIKKGKWNYIDDKKIDTSYWLKNKSILIFTRYKKQTDYFYFADLLFGESRDDFRSINKIISNTFTNSTCISNDGSGSENSDFLIPQKLQELFFYGNSNYLMPFDFLLKSKADETGIETENNMKELFLFNIEAVLKNDLSGRQSVYNSVENYVRNFDGYHISGTHFKIGNKVHSSDFYYAKRLFQNSFYAARLAMHLAKKINEANANKTKPFTLIGYEMYSELILSLIEKFLREDFNYSVNHLVAQSKGSEFDFLPKNIFEDYLDNYGKRETIIIVPIAATGSTARKIENEIKNQIYEYVKGGKPENEKKAEEAKNRLVLFKRRYNIILAQDFSGEFDDIKNTDENQESIINLDAKWYNIKDCKLCYGEESRPLFHTDDSSLTPSLIFGNPEGQKQNEQGQIKSKAEFDKLHFEKSLRYKSIMRNDNYRIYDVDTDIFINDNRPEINNWLKNTVKPSLEKSCGIKPTDKVVIVAPCHESNSQFINLINENVFYSAATIIHHQNDVDYAENFKLLNINYLKGDNTKIFYVDDSLITGKHFFELFDLVKNVIGTNKDAFTASIFLNDQAVHFIHDRVIQLSMNNFSFSAFNQPPNPNILENRPLEHEHIRYKALQEKVLHAALQKYFKDKADKLRPKNEKSVFEKKESKGKQNRHLKLFEATHKIFKYFTKNADVPDLTNEEERNKFVDFKLGFNDEYKNNDNENQKALLKVLSQYPFILYKNLRIETFKWHNELLKNIDTPADDSIFNIENDYEYFKTFKFLFRRAYFLDNYQVLKTWFLEKLFLWFVKIDKYFEQEEKQANNSRNSPVFASNSEKTENNDTGLFGDMETDKKEAEDELNKKIENLRDFPVFVLGNYIEMIQKNGWAAYHILENIKKFDFMSSKQGRQFLCMLQIEAASVIGEFIEMIFKEYNFPCCDICKTLNSNKKGLDTLNTEKIKNYFRDKGNDLNKTNKYSAAKEIFLKNSDIWENEEFVNFLWIKQLLYADTDSDKEDRYLLKGIDYQEKIDAVINKMKGLFRDKKIIKAFFIVTDGQEKPYVQYQQDYILSEFKRCLERSKENQGRDLRKFQELITFLNGKTDSQSIACETTAEYIRDKGIWKNIYDNMNVNLDFMPDDSKWLYMIHISELKESVSVKDDKKIIAQGLLGFYGGRNFSDDILPKQLLMLLRKDVGSFIKKHLKNDEFSNWVLQKEKADSQFMRLHSIGIYDSAIKYYKDMIKKQGQNIEVYIDYFYVLETWLAGRILLLSILDKEEKMYDEYNYETFKVEEFIRSIRENYRYILSFHNLGFDIFSDTDIKDVDTLVELSDAVSDSDKNIDVTFLKKLKDQVIFEVFYNIRKHTLNDNYRILDEKKLKVKIELKISSKDNIKYLEISNNFCSDKLNERDLNNKINSNEQDGLNFLNNVFAKTNIAGGVFIKLENSSESKENNRFVLNIPVTKRSV